MNYIFSDLFCSLNGHKNINNYDEFIEFENKLDKLIQQKIIDYKEKYKSFSNQREFDTNDKGNKYLFQNIIQESIFEVKGVIFNDYARLWSFQYYSP